MRIGGINDFFRRRLGRFAARSKCDIRAFSTIRVDFMVLENRS